MSIKKLQRFRGLIVPFEFSKMLQHLPNQLRFDFSEVCTLGKDPGLRCTDYTVRFYYNDNSLQCERFWYGGCGGNKNNFKSFDECRMNCGKIIFYSSAIVLDHPLFPRNTRYQPIYITSTVFVNSEFR